MKFLESIFSRISKIHLYSKEFFKINGLKIVSSIKMEGIDFEPPSVVRNMTSLDRTAFKKVVSVPCLIVPKGHLSRTIKKSKKYLVKLMNFNSVVTPEGSEETRHILLNPALIKSQNDIQNVMDINLEDIKGKFSSTDITVNYENWKCDQILRAVLPETSVGSSGYSIIGHILHLNLREHLLPFKELIAQVYLDKISNVSLIVNKADIIDNSDNTFRSFSMEKLAGETESTVTSVKENNCTFKFDFSKVYWNPRLSTEHERIINKFTKGDILYDVMAGVGPFSIPAAKKHCHVFANDLNPHSYEALKENCKLNKVTDQIECFNIDGNEFIQQIIKDDLKKSITEDFASNIHITMNLPSIAVDFLPSFIGLYDADTVPSFSDSKNGEKKKLPIIHIYMFSFNETKEFAIYSVASKLGYCLKELEVTEDIKAIDTTVIKNSIEPEFLDYVIEVVNVRRVAPAKVMFRVSFYLPLEILTRDKAEKQIYFQPSKKLKVFP